MATKYRKNNFIASDNREPTTVTLHPDLVYGLNRIKKLERKSLSWVVETALVDYFNLDAPLKELKTKPKPAYNDNISVMRRRLRA